MSTDTTRLGDDLATAAGYQRPGTDTSFVHGHGVLELFGPDGELKQRVPFTNLITQVGEQMYGERGAGITTTAVPTGMQLGTGTSGATKTGATSTIGTLVASSLVALDNSTPTSSLSGASTRRITYHVTWAAGTATANAIAEVVLTNQSTGTQTAVPQANSISRALLSPTVNKGASDSLAITWNHDIGT